MTEILLTGSLSLNSINKQVRAAVIGLIALKFDSKTINIFAFFFHKESEPFHKTPPNHYRTYNSRIFLGHSRPLRGVGGT